MTSAHPTPLTADVTRDRHEVAQATDDRIVDAGRGARILFRGGTVLRLDAGSADLAIGDVLIGDGRIIDVAPDLSAAGASSIVVDVSGCIVLPGLIDAHRHAWQGAFRRLIVDADLDGYVATTHGGMALHYRPEDMYLGTLVSMLGAIEHGMTTVLDFSHNSRSAAHSDAVLQAYQDAGIRAVHASAAPNAGEWDRQWPEDISRLADEYAGTSGALISLRLGVDMNRVRPLPELIAFARERGFGITMDGVHGTASSLEVSALARAGLLGPDLTLIHANDMDDEAWDAVAATGTGITLAPTSDEQIGIGDGHPPIQRALDHGIDPSLSTDVEISLSGDLLSQMRNILTLQRMDITNRKYFGETALPPLLSNRDVLRFATRAGAHHLGLGATTGRLAPGAAADLIVIRADQLVNMPLNNAVGTVVQGADSGQIDTVVVGGEVRRWRGRSVYADVRGLCERLRESRDRLATLAGWHIDPLTEVGNRRVAFGHLADYIDARKTD